MTPDEIFSLGPQGQPASFDDVVASGLDHDLSERHPALRALVQGGTPRQRAFAAAMLAAWGVRDGLIAIIDWAENPASVPWRREPAKIDRFSGADATFALFAHALEVARDVELTPACALLRVGAARALCLIHDQVCFERDLCALFDSDDVLAARARGEIETAVEIATTASTRSPPFDVAAQAAFLTGPLCRLDDARGAAAAEALLALHPGALRVRREIAFALGAGRGAATLAVLERLRRDDDAAVRTDAAQAHERRKGIVLP